MSLSLSEREISRIVELREKRKAIDDEIGRMLAAGLVGAKVPIAKGTLATSIVHTAHSEDLDLDSITWMVKGGTPAPTGAGFAYAFAYTQDGVLREDALALVEAIRMEGEVTVSGFTYKLSGRDNRLLNRVKAR